MKTQVKMETEHKVKQAEMQVMQQFNQKKLELHQATCQHKAALEQQAMQLTMEFQTRKAHEEMVTRQYELQKEHADAQNKFNMDMQRIQQTGNPPVGGPGNMGNMGGPGGQQGPGPGNMRR